MAKAGLVDDIKWLRAHSQELQDKYPNMYVAVYKGRIIAADKNFGNVYEKARPYGDKALIEFVFSGDLIVL